MMANAFIDRRRFLGWGALGGVLLAAGCSEGGGAPQTVTTPPVEGGNRRILQKTLDTAPTKGKKK
jgi:hypothetical protein